MSFTDDLTRFAQLHDFAFEEDPFHASTGGEFRQRTASGIHCAGYLCSPDTITFYTRRVKRRKTVEYREVKTLPKADLAFGVVTDTILALLNSMTD